MWHCPKCQTQIDDEFDTCWACGTSHDGTEDPNFVPAKDPPPPTENRPAWPSFGPEHAAEDAAASGGSDPDSTTPLENWIAGMTTNVASRFRISLILGAFFTLVGLVLRLSAHALAWPVAYSFSGPRADTVWASRERAYEHVGLAILAFGLALVLITVNRWLAEPGRKERER